MRWKEAVVFFVAFLFIKCHAKGGSKGAKSNGGIDSTTDRKIEYMLYTVGEVSRIAKDFGAVEGEKTGNRAGKAGVRPSVKKGGIKSKSLLKLKKVSRMLGKMAPFLGVAGFLAPFILAFFGEQDQTLKIIQKNFFEVNEKLDKIDSKLDEIKVLITSEVQKASYIHVESDITFGYRQMNLMFKEIKKVQNGCKTKEQCSQDKIKIGEKFSKKMQATETALHTLLRGLAGSSSEVQKSLMSVVMKETKCNIPQMVSFYEKMFSLSRQGQMVVLVLQQLQGSKMSVLESTNHWLKSMYAFRDRMYETTNHCYTNVRDYVYEDLEKMSGTDVKDIKIQLDRKYDWVEWVSGIVLRGGFLCCGSRKLTYFYGGKRKYSVISTAFGHKNSDGNGNVIF